MRTNAVTEEAPAVSDRHIEQEPSSYFLPTDEHYRLTGEMPADQELEIAGRQVPKEEDRTTKETENESEKEEASAASGKESVTDDASAAPDAKTSQEKKGPPTTKTAHTSETRWQKRERELQEARAEIARLKAQPSGQRDTQQVSQPATETKTSAHPEPKVDDVDPKTGKLKYDGPNAWADYQSDLRKWDREEALRQFQETHSKTERERQQSEAERVIEKTVNERVQATRKIHTDYDDVTSSALNLKDEHGQDALFWTKGSPIDGFFLDSDRGHEVLYHVSKNFDAHKHIFARDKSGKYLLNPIRQLRELAKIEATLDAAPATEKTTPNTSAKPITQAPRPPHQVSGKGTVAKDTVVQAVEDGDSETYMREANARDPRVLAVLASRKGK